MCDEDTCDECGGEGSVPLPSWPDHPDAPWVPCPECTEDLTDYAEILRDRREGVWSW